MNGLGPGGSLLDRFFERQRREIVDRVLREQSTSRRRRSLTALAAAALAAVAFGGIVLERGPGGEAGVIVDLWDLPAYHTVSGEDPLAAFGRWPLDGEDRSESVLDAFAVPSFGPDSGDDAVPDRDGGDALRAEPADDFWG